MLFITASVIIFNSFSEPGLNYNPDDLPFRKIEVGEEITYIVKYLFISIGEIKLKVTKR
ncbi:MAG: hypothetical protein AMXMBFR50_20870, partial [Ignavibacterium album]